jgi:hypothetical protein
MLLSIGIFRVTTEGENVSLRPIAPADQPFPIAQTMEMRPPARMKRRGSMADRHDNMTTKATGDPHYSRRRHAEIGAVNPQGLGAAILKVRRLPAAIRFLGLRGGLAGL